MTIMKSLYCHGLAYARLGKQSHGIAPGPSVSLPELTRFQLPTQGDEQSLPAASKPPFRVPSPTAFSEAGRKPLQKTASSGSPKQDTLSLGIPNKLLFAFTTHRGFWNVLRNGLFWPAKSNPKNQINSSSGASTPLGADS